MKLSDYLREMPVADRAALARACGTTYGHLKNVAFSGKPCGEKLAMALELATDGAVTRRELRPTDWWEIWHELVTPEFPAPVTRPALQLATTTQPAAA